MSSPPVFAPCRFCVHACGASAVDTKHTSAERRKEGKEEEEEEEVEEEEEEGRNRMKYREDIKQTRVIPRVRIPKLKKTIRDASY